jgi:hypothetical protein
MSSPDSTGADARPNPAAAASAPAPEPAVLRRLEAVERENRRLRRLSQYAITGTAIGLGVAAMVIFLAARRGIPGLTADTLESHQFVLRDKRGTVRGVWDTSDKGLPRLMLQGVTGATGIKLSLLDDGTSGLAFSDSAGRTRAVVALLADGTSSLAFADERGITRSVLSVSPAGGATLVFADRNGNNRSGMGVDARGQAVTTMNDDSAQPDTEADSAAAPAPPGKR